MSCPFITEMAPVSCGIVYALMTTIGLVWFILLSVAIRVIMISREEYLDDDGFTRKGWRDEDSRLR